LASREALGADHALRRFLVPFLYQTIAVNDNARTNLISENSLGPRNFAFSSEGLKMAWAAAPALLVMGPEQMAFEEDDALRLKMLCDREAYINFLKTRHGIDTPYWRQSLELVLIFKRFVRGYLQFHYPEPADLRNDAEAAAFLQKSVQRAAQTSAAVAAFFPLESISAHLAAQSDAEHRELTVSVVAQLLESVTSIHEQVGTMPAFFQDVSFTAFNWP
ncbi:hypothetical protein M885DRAFT_418932, partial [Pelagophyceae sp. CCMP2097]